MQHREAHGPSLIGVLSVQPHRWHVEVPRIGIELELQPRPVPQPQRS